MEIGLKNLKYILTDLDGVIRHYPRDRDLELHKKYLLPQDAITEAAFEKHLLKQVVCGHMTDEQWRLEITKKMTDICSQQVAEKAVIEWSDFPGLVDGRYLNYLEQRFFKVPIALLTNATSRLGRDLNLLGLTNHFSYVFNSSDMGLCKPDPEIFNQVIRSLRCEPSEILFVDDSSSNIQSAEKAGFNVHQYRTFEEFQIKFG